MTASLVVEIESGIATLRFIPPQVLDIPTRLAMAAAFDSFAAEPAVRVVVVAGGAETFLRGDVAMLANASAKGLRRLNLQQCWRPVATCPKPVIAAVAGVAWGAGCELALMCDLIVMERTAELAQPESRLGVMPGAGGAQRLLRTLGRHLTGYLLMTGDALSGERAHALGLACALADEGGAYTAAMALASRIAAQPPLALVAIKEALRRGADLPLEAATALDHEAWLALFETADQKEGMAAVLAKRTPSFTGR